MLPTDYLYALLYSPRFWARDKIAFIVIVMKKDSEIWVGLLAKIESNGFVTKLLSIIMIYVTGVVRFGSQYWTVKFYTHEILMLSGHKLN